MTIFEFIEDALAQIKIKLFETFLENFALKASKPEMWLKLVR